MYIHLRSFNIPPSVEWFYAFKRVNLPPRFIPPSINPLKKDLVYTYFVVTLRLDAMTIHICDIALSVL